MGIHHRVGHSVVVGVMGGGRLRRNTRKFALTAMVNTNEKPASLVGIVADRVRNNVIGATVPDMLDVRSVEEQERPSVASAKAKGR